MKIAYFINQYPKVSHSFIRREILALEKLGYSVQRFAIRTNQAELVDPVDLTESEKTQAILALPITAIISSIIKVFVSAPLVFFKVLLKALKIGWHSERGLLLHLFYLAESCVLLKLQQQTEVEHIHAHFGTNSTTVVMLAHLLGGVSYSFTVHGPEEFDKPQFIALAEKVQHSKFVVAISSYGRSQLFRWIPLEQWSKVNIIHCGLEADFFTTEPVQIQENTKLICVGRLCEQKGQLLLIEALNNLHLQGVNCQLVLAGDGPMRAEIEQRIRNYGLEELVKITGWISSAEVKKLLIQAKALVLPSFAEGLPVVIMEAMALKKPVISTYVAGIPELVQANNTGWLVVAGDVMALTLAMQELLQADATTLANISEQGFQRVLQQHNIDIEAKKLANLFKAAIENVK